MGYFNMKRLLLLIVILCPILFARDFYVSPDGSDAPTAVASKEKPAATIGKAVERARKFIETRGYPQEGITIQIAGGVYRVSETIKIDDTFKGTQTAPIVIKPEDRREVSIMGGVEIPLSSFTPVTDQSILVRLPEQSREKVLQVDIKTFGVVDLGEMPLFGMSVDWLEKHTSYRRGVSMPELFVDNKAMTLARWPNDGFVQVDEVLRTGSVVRNWEKDVKDTIYVPVEKRGDPDEGFIIRLDNERIKSWVSADDAWMHGFWNNDWADQSARIGNINPDERTIESVHPSGYGVAQGRRFYVYNLIEELDVPGEWYLDRSTGKLYLYPPDDIKKSFVRLSLCTEPIFTVNGASNLIFRGLAIGTSRGDGIKITQGKSVCIQDCTIGLIGGLAVSINGGSESGLIGCCIHDCGSGGVLLNGGNRLSLEPAGHFAKNNDIVNYSRVLKTYGAAISLSGVGNSAICNRISKGPHVGINFTGNDHLVEGNEIFDVCMESNDMAAIYSGRSFTMWGNRIRNNYIHRIRGISAKQCAFARGITHAIYLDDHLSGVEIDGNIFVDCNEVLAFSGSDNRFTNNLVLNCTRSIWDKSSFFGTPPPVGRYEKTPDFSNPKSLPRELHLTITTDVLAMPYQSPVWKQRYPQLAASLNETYGPWRVEIADNILIESGPLDITNTVSELGRTTGNKAFFANEALTPAANLDASINTISRRLNNYNLAKVKDIGPARFALTPLIAPSSRGFAGELTVQILGRDGDQVHYTLDGSEPDETSPLYNGPFVINQSRHLRAIAFKPDGGFACRSGLTEAKFTAYTLDSKTGVPLYHLPCIETAAPYIWQHFRHGVKHGVNLRGSATISVNGVEYPDSLLLVPRSREDISRGEVTFKLDGELLFASRFTAMIGIEDSVAVAAKAAKTAKIEGEFAGVTDLDQKDFNSGQAVFSVEIYRGQKWERIYTSETIRGLKPPVSIVLDIAGAEQVRLITTDGGGGILNAHAVWIEPSLRNNKIKEGVK